ncbi:hypothetical protein BSY18_3384 [Blastomonas sp. RAC04]|uniref:hypothetical protein n=1 Tax=Blastomonas sp. RAC04 TaxID=1842535 RepID=UPI0008572CE2|nr:hypothetical protein [Blastomonas sp. RAC04]AOG00515.1 hypothetical protein BSY18_3384 [Blastomonas sp. RAC04]
MTKFLSSIEVPSSIITPIDSAIRFPEILKQSYSRYEGDIALFHDLIKSSASSAELLDRIRSSKIQKDTRMSLLKMFRRCVAPVIDTEMSKKITKVTTEELVNSYGATFKPIEKLQEQFAALRPGDFETLAALVGEYDTRGQSGYALTEQFFDWFETQFPDVLTIEGPRRAGRDVELSSIFTDFVGGYPCDFVIRTVGKKPKVLAVGFARYDATRGGAQSDDRTGGNRYKVEKARQYCAETGRSFRVIFLADGPGLAHRDTWQEACEIDGEWDGNVRVASLKLAPTRITLDWLIGDKDADLSEVSEVINLLAKAAE